MSCRPDTREFGPSVWSEANIALKSRKRHLKELKLPQTPFFANDIKPDSIIDSYAWLPYASSGDRPVFAFFAKSLRENQILRLPAVDRTPTK